MRTIARTTFSRWSHAARFPARFDRGRSGEGVDKGNSVQGGFGLCESDYGQLAAGPRKSSAQVEDLVAALGRLSYPCADANL